VSVGNLTFGGTGKTPFVIYACQELARRRQTVAILSRGYRAHGPEGNDEALVLRAHLPDVPHLQNPDRFAAGSTIQDDVDVFVLDDGFQHHPLKRDADIVLVDATDPFGGGYCPPAGRLREPLSSLARADLVVLTRADQVARDSLGDTMREVRTRTTAPVVTGVFRPECAETLTDRDVLVACAIGNPRAFRLTVEALGGRIREHRVFRDHHAYSAKDVDDLAAVGLPVVVTEKDAVKLRPLWPTEPPLIVVKIEFEATDGAEHIAALLDRVAGVR
jgi:tetraacyldisaccharide 4'-kinase